MGKRVHATISNDLFTHILVLKEYGNYKSLSALVEESLEKHYLNIINIKVLEII